MDKKVNKQRKTFEMWAKPYGFDIKRWNDGSYMANDTGCAYEAWKAAQEDKLEFARKCLKDLQWEQPFVVVSVEKIIAKVEQEQ